MPATDNSPKLKVEFLGYSSDPAAIIYSAFRICYSRDNAKNLWKKIRDGEIPREQMEKFIDEKLGTGHTSPLRQAQFVFVVDNISRAATAQFNRHHIGIEREEMSQRYVNFNKGIKAFITPPSFLDHPDIISRWQDLQKELIDFYNFCLDHKIKQEDARFALPMGTVSREQFSMGLQAMQQFLDVRLCERAQWEIRDMGWQIYKIMRKEFPVLGKKLGIKCWENRKMYCDEDPGSYQNCKWSKSRPHKSHLEELWKADKKKQ